MPKPKTPRKRSAERAEFLASIVTTALEGGIGYWSRASEYRWFSPTLSGGLAAPGPDGVANAYAVVKDVEGDGKEYAVGVEEIAAALAVFSTKKPLALHERYRAQIVRADRTNDGCEIDSDLADAIFQVASLGDVIYG